MAELYVYDTSTHLTTVQDGSVELSEAANMGEVGNGSLIIEDTAGTLTITGHKAFRVQQDQCSTVTNFRGYVADRSFGRATDKRTGASRDIAVDLVDLNARLGFHVIFGTSWKRPAETISARLTALLASTFLSGLVADNGFVDYPTVNLDEADLRGQRPADVLLDMATRVGFNFFVTWDESQNEAQLWFQDSNTSTDFSSTLRISNVSTDIDETTTFAASEDTKLTRSPARVVSKAGMPFKNGFIIRSRASTETTYEARDGMAPNAQVKKWAKARDILDLYLYTHRNEEDTITTTLHKVPDTKVNLIRAGQRIECKFSHYNNEGYGSFTWFRVMKRTVKPLNAEGALYDIDLILSPQEAAQAVPTLVQYANNDGASDLIATMPASVTVGNVLVVIMMAPQGTDTTPQMHPNAGGTGSWTQLDTYRNAYEAATPFIYGAAWAKVATSTNPDITRQSGGPQKARFGVWEIANTSIANLTAIGVSRQPSSPMTVGTLNGAGIGVMGVGVTRGSDQTTWDCNFTPGTGWTERLDSEDDGNTAMFMANGTVSGSLSATGTINITGGPGQSVGEWCGFAVLAQ